MPESAVSDGGALLARALAAHGVRTLFTLCGGHTAPVLIGARRAGLRVIDVRHEASAVFAADALARLEGTPGVAVVTAGPGVTNTVTAVKNAQQAQSPVVVIGGAAPTVLQGRGALQDIDQRALMAPHVKAVLRVTRRRDLVRLTDEALRRAAEPMAGPVFLECPLDVLYPEALVREWYLKGAEKRTSLRGRVETMWLRRHLARLFAPESSGAPPRRAGLPEVVANGPLARAAGLLAAAERPLLLLGSQVLQRPAQAVELASALGSLGVPVYLSGLARGLLGADHPLQVRHGRRRALGEADLVLLAGSPTDFRLDYGRVIPRRCALVKVNLDRGELRRNRRGILGVHADPARFLIALAERAPRAPAAGAAGWLSALRERDAERDEQIVASGEPEGDETGVHPVRLFQAIGEVMDEDATLIGDGGDFVATAAYVLRPGGPLRWLDPGVFGTLGIGGGFAVAAAAARGSQVWLLWGDGSCGFSIAELDTMARHGLGVIAVVGNDASWAQIARDQVRLLGDDVGTVLAPTAYERVAEGFGGRGIAVRGPDELPKALEQAIEIAASGVPVLLNVLLCASRFREGSLSM
ncbi:MAG: thiamine pyrophosphate-binding protein [Planctomycetota bacterium]|jgi:acetolactate synthase-1/2/3 large subunit|nr:thiamine pyrophosphate-binding protein [Planctomycetota bacterium]MDP6762269.1 thiamine pyrophosphate-binding protein [Planctomycetota bacterium]